MLRNSLRVIHREYRYAAAISTSHVGAVVNQGSGAVCVKARNTH